jgi:phosphate transport system protein
MPDLQDELTDLRRAILSMGASVEQRVNRAIDSLLSSDLELAREVGGGDEEIDAMDVDIEAECLRILALSQPVAGDLRFVLAVMRINSDLERIADMAEGISKRVIDLQSQTPIAVPSAVVEMAGSARRMLAEALSAFADEDVALCLRIRRSDRQVDDLQREVFAWIQDEIPRHVEATRAAIDILSIARKLERIADQATNIAEDVYFIVKGAVIRHTAE